MPKLVNGSWLMVYGLVVALLVTCYLLLVTSIYARVSQEDIQNQRIAEYNTRIKNYSPPVQERLETFSKKIANLNKSQTDQLDSIMIRQGQIIDEYIRRNNIQERQADGINRNLDNPVENARYWITYAHEAVAFQAAKLYLITSSSESNINTAIINTISSLQSDIGVLKGKVIKSQNILKKLINK